MPEDIQAALTKLLDQPLADEKQVLQILIEAVVNYSVDPTVLRKALQQTINNYETNLRVIMIAIANTKLKRIFRMINLLDKMEEELATPARIRLMEDKDFIRAYATVQTSLMQSLDYVKKIVDMRVETQQAESAIMANLTSTETTASAQVISKSSREKLRRIIGTVIETVDSIEVPPDTE